MPRSDHRFDFRDLAAAVLDSFHATSPISLHLFEILAVRLELGVLAGELLPPLDHYVDILRIEFEPVTDTLGQFGSRKSRATSQERVKHPHRR